MSEQSSRPEVVEVSEAMRELAHRPGTVEDWQETGIEHMSVVWVRLRQHLGVDKLTPEMRQAGINESRRQETLWSISKSEQLRAEREAEYRLRMGSIATGLVDALVSPDDNRDRSEIEDKVLDALRPLDDRLQHTEWDGVIR